MFGKNIRFLELLIARKRMLLNDIKFLFIKFSGFVQDIITDSVLSKIVEKSA